MATLAADGSSRFSPAERPAILAALEEFTNALAIYHGTLRKPTEHDNDILDCLPLDTEYVMQWYVEANDNTGGKMKRTLSLSLPEEIWLSRYTFCTSVAEIWKY